MGRTSDAKERLLEAALDLIWERSYGTVTIDNICEKAGVKKGSFYYFFDSKSSLAVAALEEDWQQSGRGKWDSMFSPCNPPLERLKNYLEFVYSSQARLKEEQGQILGCPCFTLGSEISTQDEAIRVKVQELLQRQVRYFESAIRDAQAEGSIPDGDPSLKARCLFALVEGSMTQARIHNDLEILRILPQAAMDMLGVRTPAPAPAPAVAAGSVSA
jgi:TetR/AcrR family transcriptional repressor of nem operon